MVAYMKTAAVLFALLFVYAGLGAAAEISNNSVLPGSGEDSITHAYRMLSKTGNYEEKKQGLKVFLENYNNERVEDMIVDLLDHYYNNENFAENDQVKFYDDLIAEELVKILGKNGSNKGFPALLKIVINSRRHRDDTVKEAWSSMEKIKW